MGIGRKEEIHRHSGWLIPAALLLALLFLSGLLLGWYLRPGIKSPLAPQTGPVTVKVRGLRLAIPANFIEGASSGGEMDAVRLVALFPSWHGYSESEARRFLGNAPDSSVIRLALRGDPNSLEPGERLKRLYLPHVINPGGEAAPFGLTRYDFAADSGYQESELFAGQNQDGLLLFLCDRASPEFPSPNCLAFDRPPARNLNFSYRFKRAWLGRWRELSGGAEKLIAKFHRS